jgi:hypothetical protein
MELCHQQITNHGHEQFNNMRWGKFGDGKEKQQWGETSQQTERGPHSRLSSRIPNLKWEE